MDDNEYRIVDDEEYRIVPDDEPRKKEVPKAYTIIIKNSMASTERYERLLKEYLYKRR